MEKFKVVVYDSDAVFREKLREVIGEDSRFKVELSSDLSGLERALAGRIPAAVIIGINADTEAVLSLLSDIVLQKPFVVSLMVVKELNAGILKESLRAGVKDVLEVPLNAKDFLAALNSAADYAEALFSSMPGEATVSDNGKRGKIVTLFSTKGGVGKTVIATNLAVSSVTGEKTVYLVDLDLQSGDVAVMLNLEPTKGIYEAYLSSDNLDAELMDSLTRKHSSGLRTLLAPANFRSREPIAVKKMVTILHFLRGIADLIVIDTPAITGDLIYGVLEESDDILLVATPDLPSVKNAKVANSLLEFLGIDRKKVRLVVNRFDSKVGLTTRDVEKAVKLPVFGTVPSDRIVPRSVNEGAPVVLRYPKSEVARSINRLVEKLTA